MYARNGGWRGNGDDGVGVSGLSLYWIDRGG